MMQFVLVWCSADCVYTAKYMHDANVNLLFKI